MYEELISRLKNLAMLTTENGKSEIPFSAEAVQAIREIATEAADAIEKLNRKVEDFESMREISPEAEYAINKHADNLISKLDKLISDSEDKPRWIPVTERLPDTMKDKSAYSGWSAETAPSDDLLCYLGSEKRQTVAWYSHTYNEWTTVDEKTVYQYEEVTHWMPLPEPPKEE